MAQRYVIGEAGARKLTALFNSGLVSRTDARQAGIAVEDDFADPFKVVWAQSADNGSGSWIIWLPEGDALVTADGESYDPSEDLTAVGGDYPDGWFVIPDDVIDRTEGGTLYLNVEKVEDEETGEESVEVSFSAEASTETDAYSIEICEASVDSSTSAKSVKQIVTSALVLGSKCVKSIVGDTDSSEVISGPLEISGMLAHDTEGTSCGITFTTVGERTDPDTGEKTPARIIANLKDRDGSEEDWGVHEIRFTNTQGQGQIAHVLACGDIEIGGGGGGGGEESKNSNVIGSDYIEVGDQTQQQVPKRVVKANILTGASQGEVADTHALITHDTVQKIVAKKIFTGPNGGSTIEVDGPNGRMVISNGSKSITLDLADIPNGCAGALAVNELTFTDANGNEQTYHGLFCDDIDLPHVVQKTIAAGDGISVTVSGNTITITNTRTSGGGSGGQTTSGYTGTKQVVTDVTYDESTHQLLKKVETWTYENGLLKTVVVPSSMTEITQAVEETV